MKKKIVIRVSMNDEKSRCKALQISVGMSGVESAALRGQEKDQLEVIGEEIDVVALTRRLRKKMCHADIVSVGEVKKEESAAKATKGPASQPAVVWSCAPPADGYPLYPVREVIIERDPSCVIL